MVLQTGRFILAESAADMTDVIVWLSIGFFILLPYYCTAFYSATFTSNRKVIHHHILFWLGFHFAFSVIFAAIEKTFWDVPLILFFVYATYFAFSYVFYMRDMWSKQEKENIQAIMSSKWFWVTAKILLAISTVLLIIDTCILGVEIVNSFDRDYLYLIIVIVISYAQLVNRYYRMQKR